MLLLVNQPKVDSNASAKKSVEHREQFYNVVYSFLQPTLGTHDNK